MEPLFWSEWDGNGRDDAVALTTGWTDDEQEAHTSVRRLGIGVRELRLEHGWIGVVGQDTVLDACTEDGECLAVPGMYVDEGSVTQATFAYVVVQ